MEKNKIIEPFLIKLREHIENDPDISAAGLSVKAGLSNAAIRHWFNSDSKSPTIASARKVCAALGTTLEEFMSNAQTEEEQEIVRLVSQLPIHLRQRLLGYGQGLLDEVDQPPTAEPSSDQSNPDLK